MAPKVTTEIEIAASPSRVRDTFLCFQTYPDWAKAHLLSITPAEEKDPHALAKGDKLNIKLTGAGFPVTLAENSAEQFKWEGRIPLLDLLFSGAHSFQFHPSTTTPGGTRFVQEEVFGGLLAFCMAETWSTGRKVKEGFAGFNRELKERVEGSSK